MSSKDHELACALDDYRVRRTEQKFSRAVLDDLGPSLVLPDGVLQRVVDAARAQKIRTLEDIHRETNWIKVQDYGEDVLKIVLEYVLMVAGILQLTCSSGIIPKRIRLSPRRST